MTSLHANHDPRFSKAPRVKTSFGFVWITLGMLFTGATSSFWVWLATQLQRLHPEVSPIVPTAILSGKLSLAPAALVMGIVFCLIFTAVWIACVASPIGVSFERGLFWFSTAVAGSIAHQVITLVMPDALIASSTDWTVGISVLIFLQAFAFFAFLAWLKKLCDAML